MGQPPARRAEAAVGLSLCAAVASLVSTLASGGLVSSDGIEFWVFGLFYGSWLLWAIAAGAATHSYQLRTSNVQEPLSVAHGGIVAEGSAGSAV